ncbi:TVP38/TMEM64 family protein [Haloparvum sp. AD34]
MGFRWNAAGTKERSRKGFSTGRPRAGVKRRLLAGGFVLAVVALGAWLTSPATALARLEWLAADPLRFGLALLVVAAVRPFLAWPTTALAVAVGYGYGWVGVPFAVLLVTLTALPPYALARKGRRGGRVARAGERVVGVAGDTRTVVASRLLPTPSDAMSVGAGVASVPLRPFLVGTAIGELPWVVAGVAVGVSTDRLLAGDLSVVDPVLIVGMLAGAVLLLAGPCYRAYQSRESAPGLLG